MDLLDEAKERAEAELIARQERGEGEYRKFRFFSRVALNSSPILNLFLFPFLPLFPLGLEDWTDADMKHAAAVIGYGAVKYFDLKQSRTSDYAFSFDRMLDPKGASLARQTRLRK